MHIKFAHQAEKFYRIPMAVHRVLQADPVVGRGHAVTLMALAAFLWSAEALEGTRADWAEATGISAQTLEAHLPALGSAGCLSYIQPHVGYYVLYGLAQDDQEVSLLRAAWTQAESEFEVSGESRRVRGKWVTTRAQALKLTLDAEKQASKLTLPVVDRSSSFSLNVLGDRAEQASKLTLDDEKLTLVPEFGQLVTLYEQEIGGTITAMMADEFRELWAMCGDIARWRYAFKQSIGKRSRWAYVKAIIQNPERKPEKGNGKHAGNQRKI